MEGILDKASSKYLKKERVVPLICKGAKKTRKRNEKTRVHLTHLFGAGTSFVEHT